MDFKNDKSLFKCDNDFKEYVYDKNKVDNYVSEKAIAYAKDVLRIKMLNASILLNNKRIQHVFKKNAFNYSKEDDSFVYYYKIIS
ncbi:MAG: hypothetical protein ACI35W_02360 [Anaeroplasmataceae bacterium]